ncbi:MAG: hypothetical protein Q8O94_03535 [bacterium]|nr:hypothetical protein [bacterium]
MARLPETYSFGNMGDMNVEELVLALSDMYRDLAIAINKKPDVYTRNTDGQATETFLSNGDININLTTDKVEVLTNHPTSTTVTWTTVS